LVACEKAHEDIGSSLPALRQLYQQGLAATTMAKRRLISRQRREEAITAVEHVSPVLRALDDDGTMSRIAVVANWQNYKFEEPETGQAVAEVARQPKRGASGEVRPAVAVWLTAVTNGATPRVRITHPVMWPTVAAATCLGLLVVPALAIGTSSDPPSDASEPDVTVASAAPTLTAIAEPLLDRPQFDLSTNIALNEGREDVEAELWASAYAQATVEEPVAHGGSVDAEQWTAWIAFVVDGETVVQDDATIVRLIGVDSPEYGDCGYDEARRHTSQAVLGATVWFSRPKTSGPQDKYGRTLAYVTSAEGTDIGLTLITSGLAAARYDGYDGYDAHPRQDEYHRADAAVTHVCGDENPARQFDILAAAAAAAAASAPAPFADTSNGASGGSISDPWNRPGPDLDCKDIGKRVRVEPPDHHGLDRDGDGWGCESYG
jgi:endonuclease YncB( thermonuclease family)